MQINFEEISKTLLDTQASKIPEPYRTKFLGIIQELQTEIQYKLYPGKSKTGLVEIVIDHTGTPQRTNISEIILQSDKNTEELNEEISESLKSAYKLATKNAKEDLDSQLKKLYKEMLALKKEMNAKSKNRDNRSG